MSTANVCNHTKNRTENRDRLRLSSKTIHYFLLDFGQKALVFSHTIHSIDSLPFKKYLYEIAIFLLIFFKKSLNSPFIELFFRGK